MGDSKSGFYMTEQEYLAFDSEADRPHEFVTGFVYAMAGEKVRHKLIAENVHAFLRQSLRDTGCFAHLEGLKVHAKEARSYYYPDVLMRCGKFEPDSEFAEAPILLVEVMSRSTALIDQREKRLAYELMPSVKEYLIVNSLWQEVHLNTRGPDGRWLTRVLHPEDGPVPINSLKKPLLLPFELIYEGFDPPLPTRVKEESAEYEWWNE